MTCNYSKDRGLSKGCVVYEYVDDDSDEENLTRTRECNLTSIPCKNGACHQEIILADNTDLYCSRECFHIKNDHDRLVEKGQRAEDIKMTRMTIQGKGGTGLLYSNCQLDHLLIHVDELVGRIVTVQKEGKGAFRKAMKRLRSAKSSEKDVNNDAAIKQAKEESKRRLKELLNDTADSSDDTDTSDEEDKNSYDEYLDGKNVCPCPPHPPIRNEKGQLEKAYVINICNPWEIHVQTGDMIMKSQEIEEICNDSNAIDDRLRIEYWSPNIGGVCCAKYENSMFRGRVLGKVGDSFRVKFIDYGNVEMVSANDIMQLNPELALVPEQSILFRLSLIQPVNGTWDLKTNQFCIEHLDGASVELDTDTVERGRLHIGKLNIISSISNKFKGDFGNILVQEGLAVLED